GAEARLRGVEVASEAPAEPLVVEGDPVHLQQVVLNLLQNAFVAAADGAAPSEPRRISVISARAAGRATVAVSDSGPAVGEEVLASLFKPFFTTRADGLGMGLAISKRLVEAHDGRIWARRAGERGLVVGFDLPLSRLELPGRAAAAGA
ncbi:MAG: PAS domain-containing sensor histidine kinase, partial [Thermoanaerobaculia bacterium]